MTTLKIAATGFVLAATLTACAGCSHAPETEAAPPPRADAHPLPVVQGKQPPPKLPKLPGDTRPDRP